MGPAFANTVTCNIVLDFVKRFDGICCLCFRLMGLTVVHEVACNISVDLANRFDGIHCLCFYLFLICWL